MQFDQRQLLILFELPHKRILPERDGRFNCRSSAGNRLQDMSLDREKIAERIKKTVQEQWLLGTGEWGRNYARRSEEEKQDFYHQLKNVWESK